MQSLNKVVLITATLTLPVFLYAADNSNPPFVPGRPGNTESAIAVPKGYLQIESGLVNYTRDKNEDEKSKLWSLAQTAFRYGIADRTDIQLVIQPYNKFNVKGTGYDDKYTGFGNTTIRMLHTVMGADGNSPSFGLIGFVNFVTADKELKDIGIYDDRTTGGLTATGGIDLTDNLSLTLTLGDAVKHYRETSYLNDVYGGINLTYGVTEQFSTYIEAFGDHVRDNSTQATIDLGATYLLSPTTQIDAGVNIAANLNTPDASFFIGWAQRF